MPNFYKNEYFGQNSMSNSVCPTVCPTLFLTILQILLYFEISFSQILKQEYLNSSSNSNNETIYHDHKVLRQTEYRGFQSKYASLLPTKHQPVNQVVFEAFKW